MNSLSKTLPFFIAIVFFFTDFVKLNGQQTHVLKWKIIGHGINPNDKPLKALQFEGANLSYSSHGLPYVSGSLLVNNENAQIELIDLNYSPLTPEEGALVKNSPEIYNAIKLQQDIYNSGEQIYISFRFLPIRKNEVTQQFEKLVGFRYKTIYKRSAKKQHNLASEYAASSLLQSGHWAKVTVKESGIYRISFSEIKNMGISDPENVKIYGFGSGILPELNSEDNMDDMVLIKSWISNNVLYAYLQGPDKIEYDEKKKVFVHEEHCYSDVSTYFLSSSVNESEHRLISVDKSSENALAVIDRFTDFQFHETKDTNLVHSGRQWFGEGFAYEPLTFGFSFPNLIRETETSVRVRLIARSAVNCSYKVETPGLIKKMKLGSISYKYDAVKASIADSLFRFSNEATDHNINVSITYNKTAEAEGWLDFIEVNAQRKLIMEGEEMEFTYINENNLNGLVGFKISDVHKDMVVWDVTDFNNPVNLGYKLNGSVLQFNQLVSQKVHRFVVFNKNNQLKKVHFDNNTGIVENQDIHGQMNPEMVIVTHEMFLNQANELAAYHSENDNMKCLVVTTQQVYNEFSSGTPDAGAIRNMMRMFYHRAISDKRNYPKYLLLIGDGSFDNKSKRSGNTNLIPTFQSQNSISPSGSFGTDDFYGLLDENEGGAQGLLDIGIGRFPVNSVEAVQGILNKIYTYKSAKSFGDWRNVLCFIGDDEDSNQFMTQSDKLAEYVDTNYPHFNVEKIYLDAYNQVTMPSGSRYPEVNEAFNYRVNKGSLIINYIGHGREIGLAHEKILEISDVESWKNINNMPLFMTATCEFSRFDDPGLTSAGEKILLNPKGGGIALFTTTRLVFASNNFNLNQSFYTYVFKRDSLGNRLRLGDIMKKTKVKVGNDNNKRNFTLLGDPALTLNYPEDNIVISRLNNVLVTEATDTLKAFDKVTVEGYIKSREGLFMSDFYGTIYPTVYDKPTMLKTLGNDPDKDGNPLPTFNFSVQNSIIYKGKASVNSGTFKFSFIVPKDISYKVGEGKFSFYAKGENSDATGFNKDILIGGSGNNTVEDKTGPEIQLFMNDSTFVYGSMTDSNPYLLAYIKDLSGINTVGNGIGHDITATLDEDSRKVIVLNDSYEAEMDSYQKGIVKYQLRNVEPGPHKINFKVWDIYNNSSEAEIEFVVTDSEEIKIDHLLNYPNPFTTNTAFYFEHNKANANLDVLIQVYTVSGVLVKTLESSYFSTGFRAGPIPWDGLDDFGQKIGKGVYVYKLKLRSEDGKTTEKYEKLLILR